MCLIFILHEWYCSICIISQSKSEIYFCQLWHMNNMKSSFSKRVKRQSKNWCNNANAKFRDHVLEICLYIHISEKLFTKSQSFELRINIANSFSGMALNAFWKRTLHMQTFIGTWNLIFSSVIIWKVFTCGLYVTQRSTTYEHWTSDANASTDSDCMNQPLFNLFLF